MYSLAPIQGYVNENHWDYSERVEIQQGNAQRLYVQLVSKTGRPQFLPTSTVLKVLFARARTPTGAAQSFDVTLTRANILDASVYYFDITSTQSDVVVSGGVKLSVTPTGGPTSIYPVDNLIERRSNAPGC